MSWRDLLSPEPDSRTLPWLGGRRLVDGTRAFRLSGELPPELGWHCFAITGRKATWQGPSEADWTYDEGRPVLRGVLVGDRLVPDGAAVVPDPGRILAQTTRLRLVEPGLERFARALAADRGDGQWVYVRQELPQGPEPEVLAAWQDRRDSVDSIPGVTPALDLAFRWLSLQRHQAEERVRRAEEEARRAVEEAARAEEIERSRRQEAARTATLEGRIRQALSLSGAELLDHRPARRGDEVVVQFRFERRRFECVVHAHTLRVVDAGICLTDEETGERGDTRFTLQSLPPVIAAAERQGVLHVYRHVR